MHTAFSVLMCLKDTVKAVPYTDDQISVYQQISCTGSEIKPMKFLYVATVLSHICQFHLPHLKMLHDRGDIVHVAAHDNLSVKNGLSLKYADEFFEIPFDRIPFKASNISAYHSLKKLIDTNNYDVIVCNTPVGGVLTRLAAQSARKNGTRVIYIAHGFHFYKGASIKNWLVFYPIEKLMAHYDDTLVTINKEDYQFAKSHIYGNVEHIHGVGVDSDRYHPVNADEMNALRAKEGISSEAYVILCTGELNNNKNQKTLIKAAALLNNEIPDLKILLAGNGPTEQALREQIHQESLDNTVLLLGYRSDLETIVPFADLIVSCSYREGMPLNIIEAMLCKKPVIASVNRGHTELIQNGVNGYLVEPDDYEELAGKIRLLYSDRALAEKIGETAYKTVQPYSVSEVKKDVARLLLADSTKE